MRAPSVPNHLEARWEQIAANFATMATLLEEQRPATLLTEIFVRTQALCEGAVAQESRANAKTLADNVQSALRTWQQVWPRLGSQPPFRQAVAREARLWSKKFLELAKASGRASAPRAATGATGTRQE